MSVYRVIPGKMVNWIRDHKTDILTYGGIGLMTASTITACIGTKHVIENKEKIDSEDAIVKRVWERSKYFVLATGFWAGGAYSIHSSHGILKAENAALSNTIVTMAAGTIAYRNRWKDKVGDQKEEEVFFDEKTEEMVDEDGKKKKVKTSSIEKTISTDIYFDRWCSWRADDHGDMEFDERTVKNVQAMLNQCLWGDPERYILLSRAYDMLGAFMVNEHGQRVDYRTEICNKYGWILDKDRPNGDNTITIERTKTYRRLEDGKIVPTWRLSFNVDGDIIQPAKERGLIK